MNTLIEKKFRHFLKLSGMYALEGEIDAGLQVQIQ